LNAYARDMRRAGLGGLIAAATVCAALAAVAPAVARADETPGLVRVTHHITRLGTVPVGTSVSRTFTVVNLSGEAMSLNTFEVFGDVGNWQLQLPPECHAGTVLPSGGRCSFQIVTHPLAAGRIRGVYCVSGVVTADLWQRKCGRIRGYARLPG
jgi:hypothetical protein